MEELKPLLEELARQLGTTVGYLWGILIQQANVFVVIYICYVILFSLLVVSALKTVKIFVYWLEENDEDWRCWASFVVGAVLIIFSILTGLGLITNVSSFITAILNPEYWALQQILDVIK